MTVSFTFIRCGRMDLMYTDTAMPGRRVRARLRETGQVGRKFDEHAVRLDGADNAAHGFTDGEQRRVLRPGAEQLAVGERNAPVFRLHGADSRQNGLPDGQSVARVADARHGQIFDGR